MKRALLFALLVGLAACAATPTDTESADPDLAFALGRDLSCNAGEAVMCPAGGCPDGDAGQSMMLPISLYVPDRGGQGRFCIATGCEDAWYEPTLTRAPGWTARMRTNERTGFDAELEIARDLSTFRLRQADSDGVSTWAGSCSAAGS